MVKELLSSKQKLLNAKRSEIATTIDGIINNMNQVDALANNKTTKTIFVALANDVKNTNRMRQLPKEFVDAVNKHNDLYKKNLSRDGIVEENREFLSSVLTVMSIMKKDLQLIASNVNTLIPQEIDKDNLRITELYLINYLKLADVVIDYYTFMVALATTDTDTTPPKYYIARIERSAKDISTLYNRLRSRGNKTIMDAIKTIKSAGNDVKVFNDDGTTISDYALADDYDSSITETITMGLLYNPFEHIGMIMIQVRYFMNERRKLIRDWLSTSVQVLAMKQQSIPPDDPEYARLKKIMQYYTDRISDLDKKIARYENG